MRRFRYPKQILDPTELREQARFLDTMKSRITLLHEELADLEHEDEEQLLLEECVAYVKENYRFFHEIFRHYAIELWVKIIDRKHGLDKIWGIALEGMYRLYQDCRLRSYQLLPASVAKIFEEVYCFVLHGLEIESGLEL